MSTNEQSTVISDSLITELLNVRKEISKNKNWGFDKSEKEFVKGMFCLTPQSYGTKLQNYIIRKLGWNSITASDGMGDAMSNTNKKVEIKTSLLTATNDALNLVQIRLFQPVDYYLCVAYDLRIPENYKKYMFLLTHDQMKYEVEQENASAAHGTKLINKKNRNIELRFSVMCNDTNSTFERWKTLYEVTSYEQILNYVQ